MPVKLINCAGTVSQLFSTTNGKKKKCKRTELETQKKATPEQTTNPFARKRCKTSYQTSRAVLFGKADTSCRPGSACAKEQRSRWRSSVKGPAKKFHLLPGVPILLRVLRKGHVFEGLCRGAQQPTLVDALYVKLNVLCGQPHCPDQRLVHINLPPRRFAWRTTSQKNAHF